MGSEELALNGKLLVYRDLFDEDSLVDMRAFVKMHVTDLGFSKINQTKIMTAASELGRNVLEHGLGGSVTLMEIRKDERQGVCMVFKDSGPGIANLDLALTDGYTSKNGLGLGLTGSQRLMDEFQIVTAVGQGTTVTVTKWI